jgi:S-adenosylhomocysteine hydrolase
MGQQKFEQDKKEELEYAALKQSRFFDEFSKDYPVPILSTLNVMVNAFLRTKKHMDIESLDKIVVVGVQHILETTVSLIDALIHLGIKPENIFIAGKVYSTSLIIENELRKRKIHVFSMKPPDEPGQYLECCRSSVKELWANCIKQENADTYLILDDGGRASEYMPEFIRFEKQVAIIEQTRGGLYSNVIGKLPCPLIEVASSAVKKQIEPPLIAKAVLIKVIKLLNRLKLDKKMIYGIAGNGAIGYAIAKHLLTIGCKVAVYDEDSSVFQGIINKNFFRMESLEALIINSQCLFGCTGKDITQGINVLEITKTDKLFISCTSEDKEFLSLLKSIAKQNIISIDTLSNITCLTPSKSKITIASGGFPINFDRKPGNVPAHDIEVTQGLLLGGCIQAILTASKPIGDGTTINHASRQSLDPYIQRYVVNHWINNQPSDRYKKELISCFQDIEWIKRNSGGKYCENSILYECFADTTEMILNLKAKL